MKTRIISNLCSQWALVVLLLIACNHWVQATDIPGLFGTGVNNTNALLPGDAVDPHYKLISSADPSYPGPNSIVCSQTPPWGLANGPDSKWIAPRGDQSFAPGVAGNVPGDYDYQISFDLSGFDLSTVELTGQWAVDSEGLDILINGISTGNAIPTSPAPHASWHPFTISAGFVAGTNTLTFKVRRGPGASKLPTGLRAEVSGTGTIGSGGPVAPTILVQPKSQVVEAGSNATFMVAAAGGTLSYQWRHDGVDITNATNATLGITNVKESDAGGYDVIVSNEATNITSTSAALLLATKIPTLFGTGVDNNGDLLPPATVDPHYTLVASADAGFPGPDVFTLVGAPLGAWVPDGPNSRWIAPQADPSLGNELGGYTYRTTFSLEGFDPSKVNILGSYSPDDEIAEVYLNGNATGIFGGHQARWEPFSITNGFVAGTNTLEFVVANLGSFGPTGLRVDFGAGPPLTLAITRSGNDVIISWLGTATLQSADEVSGPWVDVPGASSPLTVTPSGTRKFYRLRRGPEVINVQITVEESAVGMGRSVTVQALATHPDGRAAADCLLLPYVNGKRWGAHEYADALGHATFLIPLPNPGEATIQIAAHLAQEHWIWAPRARDNQTVYLQKTFDRPAGVNSGKIWIGADESATVYLNGQSVGLFSDWKNRLPVNVSGLLQPGRNVLSITGVNGSGPAGVLVRLEMKTTNGLEYVFSDRNWRWFGSAPAGWPTDEAAGGNNVLLFGMPDGGPWNATAYGWPAESNRAALFVGSALQGGNLSNPLQVQVNSRTLQVPPKDPNHLIGAQYCTLFTPLNFSWYNAQAVPLIGFYWARDPDVSRQHMIWLIESGVDFLVLDWVGMAANLQHWADRGAATEELIESTTSVLNTLAAMRDEGLAVPKVVFLAGIANGFTTTTTAVNEELSWINQNYILNSRYQNLFLIYQNKPLLLIFNGTKVPEIDTTNFTIRWYAAQLSPSPTQEFWTWMDGQMNQSVAYYQGQAEAMTASVGFFDGGGWTGPNANGRKGGWTFTESFKNVLNYRPRFTQLHQFQEFTGQFEGSGYSYDFYGDSYSVELSDDIEPVSLTTPGYRANDGGWGFFYLNLTRALVDLYRQPSPVTTVLVASRPARNQVVTNAQLPVTWTTAGRAPTSFTISVNGQVVARNLQGTSATVDLSGINNGPKTLRLTAEGTQSRYLLSYTEDSLPLDQLAPAYVDINFTLNIPGTVQIKSD